MIFDMNMHFDLNNPNYLFFLFQQLLDENVQDLQQLSCFGVLYSDHLQAVESHLYHLHMNKLGIQYYIMLSLYIKIIISTAAAAVNSPPK